jgi:hypothetical protein
MNFCEHLNLRNDPRRDYCADCQYEFYYGDVHAENPELQISKLINPGRDRKANGYSSKQELQELAYAEKLEKEAWDDYYAQFQCEYEDAIKEAKFFSDD